MTLVRPSLLDIVSSHSYPRLWRGEEATVGETPERERRRDGCIEGHGGQPRHMPSCLCYWGVLLCQGCATMRMALAPRERGAPPWPPAPADQAQLYLFRTAETAPAVLAEMRMDGEPLKEEPTASVRVLVVAPGPHVLTAGPADEREALTVVARAGRTYVVRLS